MEWERKAKEAEERFALRERMALEAEERLMHEIKRRQHELQQYICTCAYNSSDLATIGSSQHHPLLPAPIWVFSEQVSRIRVYHEALKMVCLRD